MNVDLDQTDRLLFHRKKKEELDRVADRFSDFVVYIFRNPW